VVPAVLVDNSPILKKSSLPRPAREVGRTNLAHTFYPPNDSGPGWCSAWLYLTLDHYRFAHAFDHLYGAFRRRMGVVTIL